MIPMPGTCGCLAFEPDVRQGAVADGVFLGGMYVAIMRRSDMGQDLRQIQRINISSLFPAAWPMRIEVAPVTQ